jgi:beta-lactamase superfamily II metal-dependent hydrolase
MSKFVVEWHARLEPNWRIPPPPVWLAAGVSGALIAVALLGRSSKRKLWRILMFASLAGLAGLLLLMIWHPFPPAVTGNALEITAIDVGQGDSISWRCPPASSCS